MTTLEKIRAEIAEIAPLDYPCDKRTPEHIRDMALEIVEKYAEQEPCDDVVSRQAALECFYNKVTLPRYMDTELLRAYLQAVVDAISKLPSVRPQEQTGKCRTCKYGEIYNELWCKCHDPLLNGVMVKMTDQCRAEEIIDLNRKYKAESEGE